MIQDVLEGVDIVPIAEVVDGEGVAESVEEMFFYTPRFSKSIL
jgi:hypothetical protein